MLHSEEIWLNAICTEHASSHQMSLRHGRHRALNREYSSTRSCHPTFLISGKMHLLGDKGKLEVLVCALHSPCYWAICHALALGDKQVSFTHFTNEVREIAQSHFWQGWEKNPNLWYGNSHSLDFTAFQNECGKSKTLVCALCKY